MWRREDIVLNDVSEEHIVSIFMVKEIRERWTSVSRWLQSAAMKMVAIRSSETSVNTISTRRYIPEDGILLSHRR
jgi:hypothetical protein